MCIHAQSRQAGSPRTHFATTNRCASKLALARFPARPQAESTMNTGSEALKRLFNFLRRVPMGVQLAVLVLTGLLVAPQIAEATEIRKGRRVDVTAHEIVNDTLVVFGETVRIHGNVNGDAIVFGKDIVIDGVIDGNLIVVGESVDLGGEVTGSVQMAGQDARVSGTVAQNLYLAGQDVGIAGASKVTRDAMVAGQNLHLAGMLGRDLHVGGAIVELEGEIARNVKAGADSLRVAPSVEIGGDLVAYLPNEAAMEVDPNATIRGETRFEPREDEEVNRYAKPGYYMIRIGGIAGGLIMGLLAFMIFPQMFTRGLGEPRIALRTMGVGFAALIGVPVAIVIVAVTLVGIPLALVGAASYALALYLGKLVVAAYVGHRILKHDGWRRTQFVWGLLLGLVVLTVLFEIPFLGGFLQFLVVLTGLGAVLAQVWSKRPRSSETTLAS